MKQIFIVVCAFFLLISCESSQRKIPKVEATSDGYFDGMLYYHVSSNLNESKKVIVVNAHKKCEELKIPSQIKIDNNVFVVTKIDNGAFKGCSRLCKIIIPSSIEAIGNEAFQGCTSLRSVIIPNGVYYIGHSAFADCISLRKMILPKSVIEIGVSTFKGCSSLETIVIPPNAKWYKCGFEDCSSIKHIYCYYKNSISLIDNNTFSSNVYETAILHVPMGYKQNYLDTPSWWRFKNISEFDSSMELSFD